MTRTVDMFAPLKAMKLKTFESLNPPRKSKAKSMSELTKRDKGIFARLLVVSRSRDLDMRAILEYPLSAVSLPLAGADGSMNKTNKSLLLGTIETEQHLSTDDLTGMHLVLFNMLRGFIHLLLFTIIIIMFYALK